MSWYLLVEAARIGTTVWLSYWTGVSGSPGGAPHKAMWYLGIYAIISGVQVFTSVIKTGLIPHDYDVVFEEVKIFMWTGFAHIWN